MLIIDLPFYPKKSNTCLIKCLQLYEINVKFVAYNNKDKLYFNIKQCTEIISYKIPQKPIKHKMKFLKIL